MIDDVYELGLFCCLILEIDFINGIFVNGIFVGENLIKKLYLDGL